MTSPELVSEPDAITPEWLNAVFGATGISGEVTQVDILSSELGDAALERKLLLKIKRFKFSKANVAEITVTYPIDFLPS